jgi:F-type H+-transporting ATPase subunit b
MTPIFDILAAAPVVESDNVVNEIAQTFNVTWPLFISQCVSFLIVAFLLKRFAFTPVQNMLEQRRARIAAGEEKLKDIERQLAETERTAADTLAKANEEAVRLIEEATHGASALSEKSAQEALAQAQHILSKAESAAKADRERLHLELKREFGRLVASTTSQVTGKVLTAEDQRRINDHAMSEVEA